MDSHPGGGGEGSFRLVSYQCFPALPGSPSNATSLKQLGRGQPEPWTRSPKAEFWVIIFCKSWCRLGVLEPSQMNEGGKAGGGGGRGRKEGSEGSVFQRSSGCLHFLPWLPGQRLAALKIPPPLTVHRALGTSVWVGGGAVPERQAWAAAAQAAARVQRGATG